MSTKAYYIYALKDPRSPTAPAFYIGKGTGVRRYDHLKADASRKGDRIRDIQASGHGCLLRFSQKTSASLRL